MSTQGRLSAIAIFLRNVLLVDLGIALLTVLAWWLIGGHSVLGLGWGLVFVGALTATAGVFSFSGTTWLSANPNYRFLHPAAHEWFKLYSGAGSSGNAPVLVMLVAGLISAFGGLTLMLLFPL